MHLLRRKLPSLPEFFVQVDAAFLRVLSLLGVGRFADPQVRLHPQDDARRQGIGVSTRFQKRSDILVRDGLSFWRSTVRFGFVRNGPWYGDEREQDCR